MSRDRLMAAVMAAGGPGVSAESAAKARARKAPKDWKCQECGRRMTLRAAERAVDQGCPGCGGVDVDLDPER